MGRTKAEDDDTEWLPQAKITELTGMSASWVHAQGAKGTVRRREAGKWHGRPKYEYAYSDVIREADSEKVRVHQEGAKLVAKATPPQPAPRPLDPMPVTPPGWHPAPASAASVDGLLAWLRDGVQLGHITREQAREWLAERVKL